MSPPTVLAQTLVKNIKLQTNDLMTGLLRESQRINHPEVHRLVHNAMTAYEEASMWAVKALTFQKEEDAKR